MIFKNQFGKYSILARVSWTGLFISAENSSQGIYNTAHLVKKESNYNYTTSKFVGKRERELKQESLFKSKKKLL